MQASESRKTIYQIYFNTIHIVIIVITNIFNTTEIEMQVLNYYFITYRIIVLIYSYFQKKLRTMTISVLDGSRTQGDFGVIFLH